MKNQNLNEPKQTPQKLFSITVIWGILVFIMGVLLYELMFLPMYNQADLQLALIQGKNPPNYQTSALFWGGALFKAESYDYKTFEDILKGQTKRSTVFSGGGTREGLEEAKSALEGSGVSTEENIILVILGWINFSLPFAGLLAFAGIVYAGFLYVANFGNDDLTGKAKNIIIYAVMGLVLIFSAYAIISTVIRASTA